MVIDTCDHQSATCASYFRAGAHPDPPLSVGFDGGFRYVLLAHSSLLTF